MKTFPEKGVVRVMWPLLDFTPHNVLYMCFVDFKKAFDCISHDKISVTMIDMG